MHVWAYSETALFSKASPALGHLGACPGNGDLTIGGDKGQKGQDVPSATTQKHSAINIIDSSRGLVYRCVAHILSPTGNFIQCTKCGDFQRFWAGLTSLSVPPTPEETSYY